MATYGVITRVCQPESGGNMASAFLDLWRASADPSAKLTRLGIASAVYLCTPMFHIGEILILDDDSREVCGHGRKPNKWNVTCESFHDIEDAIVRAKEVSFPEVPIS